MKILASVLLLASLSFGQAVNNVARMLSGINYQTGTNYTFVAADGTKVVSFKNAAPVAVSLPSALTTGFGAGTVFSVNNLGAGAVTITCTACTINGAATLVLTIGQSADIYSDGTNYAANLGAGTGGGGGGSITLKTNGTTNGSQTILNIAQGSNITATDNGTGTVTIAANSSLAGMTGGQVPIAATATTVTSSKAIQGSGTNLLSSSTVSGTTSPICTDAGQAATTTGCPNISGLNSGEIPVAGSANTLTSSKPLQGTDTKVMTAGTVSGTGISLCTDANGGATTTGCIPALIANPAGAQTITQPVSGTGTTAFSANNFANIRYVVPSFAYSYTDSGGSLGNLTAAGTGLMITLPASANSPCPAGIDTTSGGFALAGTGSISGAGTTLTMTTGSLFANFVSLPISIPGAGPAGATLNATIIAYTDSTHVTISVAASTGVSGKTITVGSYIYAVKISGTGTTEAAPVIGGAATPGATSNCTLIVNTQFNHPNGYTVSSASDGIQEAINDAWVSDNANNAASTTQPLVKLVPGTQYNQYATVYQRGWGATVDFTGALNGCFMRNYCWIPGQWRGHPGTVGAHMINPTFSPGNSTIVGCGGKTYCNISSVSEASGIYTFTTDSNHSFQTFTNGAGADTVDCEFSTTGTIGHVAGVVQAVTANTFQIAQSNTSSFSAGVYTYGFCHPLNPAIEDNTENLAVDNLQTQLIASVNSSGRFIAAVVNENDQHALINGGTNRGSSVIDETYPVGAYFFQRTDNGYAGIFNIYNFELTNVNCGTFGNGANGAIIIGGVCQAFPTFGYRYFGGFQPMVLSPNPYQEAAVGGTNPLYPSGVVGGVSMAYLFQGGGTGNRLMGTFPVSSTYPTFSCSGTAQAQRNYYVQAINGSGSASALFYIGSSQANCAGATINLSWPAPMGIDNTSTTWGALTWNVWVTTGVGTAPPSGTANATLFSSSSPTCGTNGMCTFADTQTTTSHVIPATQVGFRFWFWPAPIVLNQGSGNNPLYMDTGSNSSGVVSNGGMLKNAVVATQCIAAGSLELLSPNLTVCAVPATGNLGATLVNQRSAAGTGPTTNSKGAYNFGLDGATCPYDFVTLVDPHWLTKTLLTSGYRPAADTDDTALGCDQTGGYSVHANTTISQYIGIVPDNSTYQERLTSTAKIFAVPPQAAGGTPTLSGTGACSTQGTKLGGKWAGSFVCTGTTGAATITITPSGTAPNGWFCTVFDRTAGALGPQTGSTTTTCTATFTTVTNNDVLTFQATSF